MKCYQGLVCGGCDACVMFICSVCKAYGPTLPTECPAERMDFAKKSDVRNGLLDFVGHAWVKRSAR